jgi:hypothetical protein
MVDRASQDTALEDLERLLENDENYCRMLALQQNQAASTAIETSSLSLVLSCLLIEAASGSASSAATTPSLLDTAFLNVSTICLVRDRRRYDFLFRHRKPMPMINTVKSVCLQHKVNLVSSLKTEQFYSRIGRTTTEASSTVYRMVDTIVERQPETIRLESPKPTMVSTGTMPMTPVKMVSFGTMPGTPTGMASIGTTPSKPTPLVATTTSLSLTDRDIIDLCTPTLPVVDNVSPSTEIIDLCTPSTPTN